MQYLILLMYCFIMYWPTDNSDILHLYIHAFDYKKKKKNVITINNWIPVKLDFDAFYYFKVVENM
jgi:hypothetical protein